jgi:hypothetical protein
MIKCKTSIQFAATSESKNHACPGPNNAASVSLPADVFNSSLSLLSLSLSHSSHREGEREMPVHAIANLSIHNIAAAVTRSSTGLPLHGSAFVQPICRLHYSAVNVYVLYVPD